ncbi:hypothetical protein H6G35_18870 [Aulosira sp. FACHB-113]|uniref:hypothetical protein n=1 Tax=Tolypothrix tenuis TaxID=457083 RepID=UPI001685AFD2|nr:hypothetical protein [Aulosira sp. FACHB-113]
MVNNVAIAVPEKSSFWMLGTNIQNCDRNFVQILSGSNEFSALDKGVPENKLSHFQRNKFFLLC